MVDVAPQAKAGGFRVFCGGFYSASGLGFRLGFRRSAGFRE